MGQLCRWGVQSSNEKSLLLLGLIANALARRIRGLGQPGGEGGIRTHGTVRVVDKHSKFNEASRPTTVWLQVRVPSEPTTKSIARQSLFAVAVDSRPKDRGSAFIVRAGCVGLPNAEEIRQ